MSSGREQTCGGSEEGRNRGISLGRLSGGGETDTTGALVSGRSACEIREGVDELDFAPVLNSG